MTYTPKVRQKKSNFWGILIMWLLVRLAPLGERQETTRLTGGHDCLIIMNSKKSI